MLRVPWEGQGAGVAPRPSPGECFLQIQDIVRMRQLLTIFREGKDGQQDVDVAILQALLKGEDRAKPAPGERLEQGCSGPRVLAGQAPWHRCWGTGSSPNLPSHQNLRPPHGPTPPAFAGGGVCAV